MMKILALDASGLVASAALAEDDRLLGEYSMNTKKTHSQTLLPMVDALMQLTGEDPDTIDAVAVAGGPGSFTGLRIGSATAKGLAFAWDVPIISVPTIDALAWNMAGTGGLVCPILDARRGQTYTGIYSFSLEEGGGEGEGVPLYPRIRMDVVRPQCATTIDEIVEDLNKRAERVTFLGDGVPVFKDYIKEHLSLPYAFAPLHSRLQRAGSVASLAMRYAEEGKMEDAAMHRPTYLRETQAERERKGREGK